IDCPCEGRVEVYLRGEWGTVCSDDWGTRDADVVCRQLGCGRAVSATTNAHHGAGTGRIWLDDVRCRGTESYLWECDSRPWGEHDCNHGWDAGVICSVRSDLLRLRNGTSPCEGKVEVSHQGEWGTVCGNNWDTNDADVVCRQLGCGRAVRATNAHHGAGTGRIWLDNVRCRGNESYLWECDSRPWGEHNCNHVEHAGVICSGRDNTTLQLQNGTSPCEGRVEVYLRGEWGTVCSAGWDTDDADVVCRQLGCGRAVSATTNAHHGAGTGRIWLANVLCRGNESYLWECDSRPWGEHNCNHGWDAGVICSGDVSDAIAANISKFILASVCELDAELRAANVICRQLNCGSAVTPPVITNSYERRTEKIWTEEIRCIGNETNVLDCFWINSAEKNCSNPNLPTVHCTGDCSGRVELGRVGQWGSLCNSHWDLHAANVLCRQLYCGTAVSVPHGNMFGTSNLTWTDRFHCKGTESQLAECPYTALGNSDWRKETLRLMGGESHCEGRVEVQNGSWHRVYGSEWGIEEAQVVCRELHCGEAVSAFTSEAQLPDSSHGIWESIKCNGNESQLQDCVGTQASSVAQGCDPKKDVGVICSGTPCASKSTSRLPSRRVRLVDGRGRCAGRVEVYHHGEWGTVCDDSWDVEDANVVCRQLRCGHAISTTNAFHGSGTGKIWMDDLKCLGNETSLWDCPSSPWGLHNCQHKEDVGVICSEFTDLRLVGGTHECEGRVEVYYNGSWTSVCNNAMEETTASLICNQLNCGVSNESVSLYEYGVAQGPFLLDNIKCRKNDAALWQCSSKPWTRNIYSERIRLIGGQDKCSGRVEVFYQGAWGTVCDDSWDRKDAEVVCAQLGCGSAINATGEAMFGSGTGPIWLDEVSCKGHEQALQDCFSVRWNRSDCHHKEDAGVIWISNIPILLGVLLKLSGHGVISTTLIAFCCSNLYY
uniref:SRCR domain-containing protein n=1 Tax=Xenopus tropicalis TaxID=8364 RepID=A0A6I8QN32_XENTR